MVVLAISQLLGCDQKTIRNGLAEPESKMDVTEPQRKKGGRKRLTEVCPSLAENLQTVLRHHTAGDHVREDVKYLSSSNFQKAGKAWDTGKKAVVSQLLYE